MEKGFHQHTITFSSILKRLIILLPGLPRKLKYIRKAKGVDSKSKVSIGRVIEKNALENGDVTALKYEERSYSYQSFNEQTNKYANFLLSEGIKNGENIITFIDNRPELLFLIAACTKIGACVSLINPNQREQTLTHSLELVKSNYFFIGEELMPFFEEIKAGLKGSDEHRYYWLSDQRNDACPNEFKNLTDELSSVSMENPPTTNEVIAGQVYASVFTSGTTGLPKASRQTHRKWLASYYWFGKVNMNFNREDVLYIPLPFYHTNALVVGWSTALAASCTIVMKRKFSVSDFWTDVAKYNVSSFIYIGELCRYLLKAPVSTSEKTHRIRKIMGNGLRPEIWKELKSRFQINEVIEFYGAADGNVNFTNTLNFEDTIGWSPQNYKIVAYDIEKDLPVKEMDGFLRSVKKGETGLLISEINDKSIFDGYINVENNKAKILRNVFVAGDSWFNSGDLVQNIGFRHAQFVDRIGDTFRWKGENVATAELEGIIAQLKCVGMCAVYGVQIPNNDGRAGMVTIVKNPKEVFDLDELAQYLVKELPRYAIPIFVRITTILDVTNTHKVKKSDLKQEGFECKDVVFVMLPKSKNYVELSDELMQKLKEGEYIF
jgi:citronellyl-CoA synthetase